MIQVYLWKLHLVLLVVVMLESLGLRGEEFDKVRRLHNGLKLFLQLLSKHSASEVVVNFKCYVKYSGLF